VIKYGIEDSGFESQQDKRFVYSPEHLYWLWGPTNSLFSAYWVSSTHGWRGQCVNLTTHLPLVLRKKISAAVSLLPLYSLQGHGQLNVFSSLELLVLYSSDYLPYLSHY